MAFSISGLSGSGLDTTEIVKSLMEVEKVPYTNLESRKTQLQTEQSVFRQINTKLNTLNTAVSDLKYSFSLQAYKATSSSDAIKATATDSAVAGTYKIEVQQAAVNASAKTSGADLLAAVRSGDLKLGSGEKQIDFSDAAVRSQLEIDGTSDDEALLKRVANYINARSADVGSTVSMLKDGSAYEIEFTSKSMDPVDAQGLTFSDVKTGIQAEFTINGKSFTRNSNEIKDIIPGVSFTISEDIEVNKPVTLTVSADTDKIASKVQTFVDAYNDLITSVRTTLAKPEDVTKNINPLQGDSLLKDINSRLYDMFNQLTSAGFMEEIGLSIDKGATKASDMTGKITFDKDAFKTALTENPTKATTILNSVSENMSDTIFKTWTSSVSGVMSHKITGYDADIKRVDERLEAMDRSLQMKEARYKQQFSSMELMLASLGNTQSWLSSQFASLSNNKS